MRKIFTFITALTVGAMINVWAGVFKLAGEEILGSVDLPDLATTLDAKENVTASGTISFEAATQTLTLENATIECTNFFDVLMLSDAYDLTINLIGTNTLSQPQTTSGTYFSAIAFYDDNANLKITGSGKLILNSYKNWPINLQKGSLTITNTTIETYSENPENEKGIGNETKDAGSLVIENSLVKTNKIYNLNAITLTNSSILYPSGESQSVGDCTTGGSSGKAVIKYDGTPASNVVIFPNEITVGEVLYKSHSLSYGNRQFYVPKQAYANSSLTIPDSITYEGFKFQVHHIYTEAFQNNTNITSVDLGCVEIWGNAFQNCTNLETVTLREGIKSIGGFVFSNIKATSLALPSTLNDFPNSGSPFENNKFTEITFPNGNANFVIGDDGALYNEAKTKLIAFPYAYSKKFSEIPATVTIITMNAFSNCTNIADTLEIPAALNNANYAFHNTNIKCVLFNSNSTYLSNVFQGTAAIEEVIIGPNVTHLGELIFYRCSGIKKVVVLSKTKPVWDTENVFGDAGTFPPFATAKVYVHCGQSGDYTADANKWAKFTNIVDTLLYDVNVEAANADVVITKLAECSKVNIAVTPNSGYAFVNWDNGVETASFNCIVTSDTTITANIKKVLAVGETFTANTVEGVTVLYKVLTNAAGDKTVQVGDGSNASISTGVTGSVTIPDSAAYFDEKFAVVALGGHAFYGCHISALHLTDSIHKMGGAAISDCFSLTDVNIPTGLTDPGSGNYVDCKALESITIPGTIKYLGNSYFLGCSKLATINGWNPSQIERIGSIGRTDVAKFFQLDQNVDTIDGYIYAGDILYDNDYPYSTAETRIIKEGTRVVSGDAGDQPNCKHIVFPESVKAIGSGALEYEPYLETCTIKALTPPLIYCSYDVTVVKDATFLRVSKSSCWEGNTTTTPEFTNVKFYVPKSAVATYKASDKWNMLDIRPIGGWTVKFQDNTGADIIAPQQVEQGTAATRPVSVAPYYTYDYMYSFANDWTVTIENVGDTIYTAKYNQEDLPEYTIHWYSEETGGYEVSATQVQHGHSAQSVGDDIGTGMSAPGECLEYDTWSQDLSSITAEITVWPLWKERKFTVTFKDGYTTMNITVRNNRNCHEYVLPPTPPEHPGYTFKGWDSDAYKNVTDDLVITALYEPNNPSGIGNTSFGAEAQKVMIDGHLFILCGEHLYDAQGKMVK